MISVVGCLDGQKDQSVGYVFRRQSPRIHSINAFNCQQHRVVCHHAPNLNLIERFSSRKPYCTGGYYETFCQFKMVCDNFFAGSGLYHIALRSLLSERFQIIGLG